MSLVLTILRDIPDPRTGNAQRHDLLTILVIALVASVCGCESCVEFADFAEDREELFAEFLDLENGLPSHDTFSRLFRLLEPEALGQAFGRFPTALGEDGSGVVAFDGKTLRRSFDKAAGENALRLVTAFAADARLVIGQRAVREGGNEITAARELLALLDLKGVLVTGDAAHCQSETAALVMAQGGDYLFALKGNRPAMLREVAAFFADPPPGALAWSETTDADHGRLEVRRHAVTHAVDWLFSDRRYAHEPRLPGLASIAMIESEVTRDGKTTTAVRYYLSSAVLTPDRFAAPVRAHWRIENGVHCVLDVTFDEDRARNRKDHGPENLAIIRKLALNVLKIARPGISIRRKRKRSRWSDAFARSVIGQMR